MFDNMWHCPVFIFVIFRSQYVTHCEWDEMAAILQTTISNEIHWNFLFNFKQNVIYIYSIGSGRLAINYYWFRKWIGAKQATNHYLNQWWSRLRTHVCITRLRWLNTLRPRQNGRHFADDILKCIFLNGNVWIPIEISLKFVPKGPIDNIPALVQIMAWRRPGDKPLSEPIMVKLPTHICVTQPQWDLCRAISHPSAV